MDIQYLEMTIVVITPEVKVIFCFCGILFIAAATYHFKLYVIIRVKCTQQPSSRLHEPTSRRVPWSVLPSQNNLSKRAFPHLFSSLQHSIKRKNKIVHKDLRDIHIPSSSGNLSTHTSTYRLSYV